VLIAINLSGICGTDKHTYKGESKQYGGTPHERDLTYPLVCGHENVGVVVATGGDVRASDGTVLRPGDRVVPGANVPCGSCYYCLGDFPYYLCQHLEDYGNSLHLGSGDGPFGGWSEYLHLLPRTPIFRVPENLPDTVAVITEVMAVTHGIDKALAMLQTGRGNAAGFSVAVLGLGPLGACHLAKSRMLGAGLVAAIDVMPERLAHMAGFGIDLALDASTTDAQQRKDAARDATNGLGFDVVVDCSGRPETFPEATGLARNGGVVIEAGAFVDLGPVPFNPSSALCTPNLTIMGIGGEEATHYQPSLKLMSANLDRYPLTAITTHVLPLEDAEAAVHLAMSPAAMQVAINPRSAAA
jgi:L-iditol 2-dehydrogenase